MRGEAIRPESTDVDFAVKPRRARLDEADEVADLWWLARAAAFPAVPAPVHSQSEVRAWFASDALATRDTWVVEKEVDGRNTIIAMLVLTPGWVDQLYVDAAHTGRGVGSRLLALAKERHPERLDLWTFQSNVGARRFYERHGFLAVETTDGDNEEGAPDVRYRWEPGGRAPRD